MLAVSLDNELVSPRLPNCLNEEIPQVGLEPRMDVYLGLFD